MLSRRRQKNAKQATNIEKEVAGETLTKDK